MMCIKKQMKKKTLTKRMKWNYNNRMILLLLCLKFAPRCRCTRFACVSIRFVK